MTRNQQHKRYDSMTDATICEVLVGLTEQQLDRLHGQWGRFLWGPRNDA